MDKDSVTHTLTHTKWNIVQPKKLKEKLLFVTTWMKHEGSILS